MIKEDIRRATLSQIREKKNKGEISFPSDNASEIDLPPDFWDKAIVVTPANKTSIHLRVDKNVLDFFKSQGKGHLTRMNSVLRAYVDAKKNADKNSAV